MKFAIWSGSHVIKKAQLTSALKALKKIGFDFEISKSVQEYAVSPKNNLLPFLAGNDQLKIKELLKIFSNPTARWILATRGGYGCLRLLKDLDRAAIERTGPIYLWGYSDLTVLQLYLWQRKGWMYIQGPLLGSETFTKPTSKELKVLENIAKFGIFASHLKITPIEPKIVLDSGSYLFLGGNLASIVSMLGTPWEPRPSTNYLLFLEDIDESGYKTDRLLTQLKNSRFFENCRGLILGHFTKCEDYKNVFKSFSKSYKLPVYLGVQMGHQAPRIPIVLGTRVEIEKGKLIFGQENITA